MIVEDEQPCSEDIRTILADPQRREIVVRSLQQALYAFGYKNTLEALEEESKIPLQKNSTILIENLLNHFQYESTRKQICQLQIPPSQRRNLVDIIDQLYINQLISKCQLQKAVTFLSQPTLPQQKRNKYFAMVALENQTLTPQEIQRFHKTIIEKCKQQFFGQNNIKNIFSNYLMANPITTRQNYPPKVVIAESEGGLNIPHFVNFIKFNCNNDKLVVVAQSKYECDVSVWSIEGQTVRKLNSCRPRFFGGINGVEWSSQLVRSGQLIGICSSEQLTILNASDLTLNCTITSIGLQLPKLLNFCWHPISEIIYLGGLFNKLVGIDSEGENVTEICPFFTTRKIIFTPQGQLFAVKATTQGKLVRFNVDTELIEAEFTQRHLFMDLKYQEQKVIVTNQQFVFVLNPATLTPLFTCESPPNPKLFTIQAFLCGKWIISFNQKVRGILQGSNSVSHHKWQNCHAIDLNNKLMVTIDSSIKIWSADEGEVERISESAGGSLSDDEQSSSSSSNSMSSPLEEEEGQHQMDVYRQLMEIQFLEIENGQRNHNNENNQQ